MSFLALGISKLIIFFIQVFNLGSGSTWPGHIALKIDPKFVKRILAKNKELNVVLVVGTNGKTTTSKLLTTILTSENKRVFRNEEGANLINGIASSLIRKSTLFGTVPYDTAVFEVDENALPEVLTQITPHALVLLNLFRDQLDRYGEVHTIAGKWKKALEKLSNDSFVIANGDDPQINYIAQNTDADISFFGVSSEFMKEMTASHDVDSLYCPKCGKKLIFTKYSFSHLGDYKCSSCSFARRDVITFTSYFNKIPLKGLYNRYNINAALLTINQAFSIPIDIGIEALKNFEPAFGRQEQIYYKERNIFMLLSKNPTGFNQSLSIIDEDKNKKTVLIALNDRIPDGRDVSWIWDIDIEELVNDDISRIFITGDRAYDMGLRVDYSTRTQNLKIKSQNYNSKVKIVENLEEAIDMAVEETKQNQTLYVLPTYSAMLEIRNILTGKKLL